MLLLAPVVIRNKYVHIENNKLERETYIGICISFTKYPRNPITAKPTATALHIWLNSENIQNGLVLHQTQTGQCGETFLRRFGAFVHKLAEATCQSNVEWRRSTEHSHESAFLVPGCRGLCEFLELIISHLESKRMTCAMWWSERKRAGKCRVLGTILEVK
jgi:hypothetical protein